MAKSYRAAVGPPDKYDIIGALQFNVLVSLGLREHHKLLDIGCGSLRGGRLFIPYLKKRNYYGIEPSRRLVDQGIENELGKDILGVKHPHFSSNSDFKIHFGTVLFDFVLAQSIFSHADKKQINTCVSGVSSRLQSNGKFIFTYFRGNSDYNGSGWAQAPDATYTRKWMKAIINKYSLTYNELSYNHPSGQTWVLSEHR